MGLLIFNRPSSRITLHLYIVSLEHTDFPKRTPSQVRYSGSKNKSLASKLTNHKECPLRLNISTQLSILDSILSTCGLSYHFVLWQCCFHLGLKNFTSIFIMFPEKVQNMKFILSMKCKIKEKKNFLQTVIL